jgi:hypothetical protein
MKFVLLGLAIIASPLAFAAPDRVCEVTCSGTQVQIIDAMVSSYEVGNGLYFNNSKEFEARCARNGGRLDSGLGCYVSKSVHPLYCLKDATVEAIGFSLSPNDGVGGVYAKGEASEACEKNLERLPCDGFTKVRARDVVDKSVNCRDAG